MFSGGEGDGVLVGDDGGAPGFLEELCQGGLGEALRESENSIAEAREGDESDEPLYRAGREDADLGRVVGSWFKAVVEEVVYGCCDIAIDFFVGVVFKTPILVGLIRKS